MKPARLILAIALASVFAAPLLASNKATVKVVNKSKWEIHHLYLSPSDSKNWGPDQLGDKILESDASFTLTDIDCDKYDIKVVDEDGDECVIESQSLCSDDLIWEITDKELLTCENETE
jgi:hypothetical protein